jgi:hypothetical protein
MRQKLEPPVGEPLPASVLKHLDEQTVAALVAAYRAVQNHGLTTTSFTDWGVLAAPRFLGRLALAHTLQRYALEGAWGISPHVIPHRTLHAVSGTLSLALGIHGPNFGIDGGPGGGAAQALLAATALLSEQRLPGVWMVLSGWDHEPIPDQPGVPPSSHEHKQPPPVCGAVALALVAPGAGRTGLRLRLLPQPGSHPAAAGNGRAATAGLFSLETLLASLTEENPTPATGSWQLNCGGLVHLDRSREGGENAL